MSSIIRWLFDKGGGRQHFALLFLALIAGVMVVTAAYWLMVLEPQLRANARSNINALAQSQAQQIAYVLSDKKKHLDPVYLGQVIDEILVLTEQASGKPFFQRIELELDFDVVAMDPELIQTQRGDSICSDCFVTSIPIYDRNSQELLGVTHFYASDHFYHQLRDRVRSRLLWFAILLTIILSLTGYIVAGMIRKIRNNETLLSNLFEASPLPMLLTRPDTEQVLRANQAAITYFESTSEQIPYARTSEFYANLDDRQHILSELDLRGQVEQYEFQIKTARGNLRWVTCSIKMVDYEGGAAAIIGLTDISSFKQTQQELLRARDAAESADHAKSEFLATMSHEIRTPMNGILGMVQLLQRTPVNAQQSEYLDSISTSGEVLVELLNDILDLSKIEAGKMELYLGDFDLYHLLESLTVSLSERASQKGLAFGVEIASDVPLWVHGDSTRIRQVLINLIGNALKFTESGSVAIRVERLQSTSTKVELEFTVEDTGIGIDAESQKHLFNNFSQSDSSISRRYGGSGLGLAISKRLISAMGGEIELKSEEGQGSRFSFKVWFGYGGEKSDVFTERRGTRDSLTKPLSVLVAEDVPINRHVVRSLLEMEGHTVIEAENGKEAITSLKENEVDVILMDLHMPEMDGVTATRKIRSLSDPGKAGVPIVALTANILQQEKDNCRNVGMDGFVIKPFTIEKLLNELGIVLQR